METIKPLEKFQQIENFWDPAIIAEVNDCAVKIARISGDFIWHKHEEEDELFYVLEGTLLMKFRDKTERVGPGELILVPRGVEHLPCTEGGEVKIMLIEPRSTLNTGDQRNERTKENLKKI